MNEEERITEEAKEYARKNKKEIARRRTDVKIYIPDTIAVSVFMAGSPGAGKTESSEQLIKKFTEDGRFILRIDSDYIRKEFKHYTGKNSHLFQAATSIIADKMHDCALQNRQSFIFDGTLSNLERAREN